MAGLLSKASACQIHGKKRQAGSLSHENFTVAQRLMTKRCLVSNLKDAALTTKWMSWTGLPWFESADGSGSALLLCDRINEAVISSETAAGFLSVALHEIAARFAHRRPLNPLRRKYIPKRLA